MTLRISSVPCTHPSALLLLLLLPPRLVFLHPFDGKIEMRAAASRGRSIFFFIYPGREPAVCAMYTSDTTTLLTVRSSVISSARRFETFFETSSRLRYRSSSCTSSHLARRPIWLPFLRGILFRHRYRVPFFFSIFLIRLRYRFSWNLTDLS